jgi:geranylgeranyl reductase family protein
MKIYDAAISGAGPAGCAAALFLARKGYRVLLFDKERFPREKVCGDGLTSASSSLLEELGVMEGILEKTGQLSSFKGVRIFSPDAAVVNGRFSGTGRFKSGAFVLPRKELDDCLVSFVKTHESITFLDATTVDDVIMRGGMANGVSSSRGEFSARIVIAADGFYSPIASRLQLKNTVKKHLGFAIRAYFSGIEGLGDAIELHYDKSMLPGYGWIFPAGKQRANVGVGMITRFMDQRGLKKMFERFISVNACASRKLKHALMESGTLKAWPLPLGSYRGKRGWGNVLLVGDAGSFVDPLTGEGIYYALQSGRYAAEAAGKALAAGDETGAASLYEILWRKEFLFDDFTVGYAVQSLLNNPFLLEKLMRFIAKKQKRADLLADVIGHNRKKITLLKLMLP